MGGDESLVERRALVVALAACLAGGVVASVGGHPPVGMALFVLAALCFAVQYGRGHLR